MYVAVENEGFIYLCSETCYTRFKNQRKSYLRTRCIQCLGKLDLSCLAFRPTFGLTDRPCCSENCLDFYNQQKAPIFMCRFGKCNQQIVTSSFRWQTMEFCQLNCLGEVFQSVALKCHECNKEFTNPCQFSQRFGILLKYFCTSSCHKSFTRKNNRRCPACNAILTPHAIAMDAIYCSPLCDSIGRRRQMILSMMKENQQPGEICDICKCFVPSVQIEAKFHNYRFIPIDIDRYIFICSSKCTAAYRQHHRIAKNMCAVCNQRDWPGTGIFYRSGPYDIFIFCSTNCLSIYIHSTKHSINCDFCGRGKSFASAIEEFNLQIGSSKYFCSFKCSRILSESDKLLTKYPDKLCVIKCAHCRSLSSRGIHEQKTMEEPIVSFCSAYCQLQGPSCPIALPPFPTEKIADTENQPNAQSSTPSRKSARKSLFNETNTTDQSTTCAASSSILNQSNSSHLTLEALLTRPPVTSQANCTNLSRSSTTSSSMLEQVLAKNNTIVTDARPANLSQSSASFAQQPPSTGASYFLTTQAPAQTAPTSEASTPIQLPLSPTSRIIANYLKASTTASSVTASTSSTNCVISPRPQPCPRDLLTAQPPSQNTQSGQKIVSIRLPHNPGNLTPQSINLAVQNGLRGQTSIPLRISADGQLSWYSTSTSNLAGSVTITPVASVAQSSTAAPVTIISACSATRPQMMYTPSPALTIHNLRLAQPFTGRPQPSRPAIPYAPPASTASSTSFPSPLPPVPPPPPPTLPASSPASAALPAPHLILVKEFTKPKELSNVCVQAAPQMVSKAVMCKPLEGTSKPVKPKMVSIEIQTDVTWVDDDIMIIEPSSAQVKKITNGVNK